MAAKSRIKSKLLETKIFGLIIGLAIFFILLFIKLNTAIFRNIDRNVLDFQFRLKGGAETQALKVGVQKVDKNPNVSNDIVLIGIDKKTLDRFGKWPFPRAVEANLLNTFSRIKNMKERERAVFLDINIIERDLNNPENDSLMIESVKENGRVFLEAFFHPIEFEKKLEAEQTERFKTLYEKGGDIESSQIKGDWKALLEWRSVEAPLKPYGQVAYRYGNVSTLPDTDKVYRRQPVISRFSLKLKEIYLDNLTLNESVDPEQFERLAWKDISGRYHDIPQPLTENILADLRREMEFMAPLKDLDTDGDNKIDDSQYVIIKYKDYIVPAITLSLALDYFHKELTDIEVEIGKYIRIKDPEVFNKNLDRWEPIIETPGKYTFPTIIEFDEFEKDILEKIKNKKERQTLRDAFVRNEIFYKYFLKSSISPELHSRIGVLMESAGFSKVQQIEPVKLKKEILIPIDQRGRMQINFMGIRSGIGSNVSTFNVKPFYSFVNDPGPDPTAWKSTKGLGNKILIVGMFATGLADEKPTPYGLMFGPEVMANALNTIIMDKFLIEAPLWVNIAILFGIIMLAAFFTSRLKTIWSFFLIFILIIAMFWVTNTLFDNLNYLVSFSESAFGVLMVFLAIVVYRVMTEEKEKKKIKNMFGRYVSPTVVDKILQNPPELGGVDKNLTVMFSDIRGFTTLSERMTPQALVNHLNTYLTAMTDLILEFKGTLDKYVGDEIMCFWGAPLPQADHAVLACRCALKQMEVLNRLNDSWPPEKRFDIGIGLNSGIMTVGNMGSLGRMNYTLMGDNVNLGARLEGTNKMYHTNIIISENTYALVKDHVIVRELDNIRVKGKNKPVIIYELIDMKD